MKHYTHPLDMEEAFDDMPDAEFRYLLAGHRIKIMPVRVDILRVLSREKHPLSVVSIIEKIAKSHNGISPYNEATIYRSLEGLTKAKLVNRILIDPDRSYYEIAFGRKHHHHVVCTSCGEIEDVTGCISHDLHDMARSSGLKKFRHIESHSLEFFGICLPCNKEKNI